jgi:hypothetical protein
VIDEMSFFGVKIFDVIDNRLKSIRYIQNKKFVGLEIIMIGDFYTPCEK